ncbi:ATP-dependent protease [Clostridia bacterium]|nr:ATP-dependent protease [Clostridia bacterium]
MREGGSLITELKYDELRKIYDTEYIKTLKTLKLPLIGQPRAEKAMEFGLKTRAKGYNVYVSGPSAAGKITAAEKFAKETAEKMPTPPDLCYVYNFDDPKSPILLSFAAGEGREFRADMEELISLIKLDLRETFASPEVEDGKNAIVRKYQDNRDLIIKEAAKEAKQFNFGIKTTQTGVYFIPMVDGETISEEQFDALDEETKESITKSSGQMQSQTSDIMRRIKAFEKTTHRDVDGFEYTTAMFSVGRRIAPMLDKYEQNEKAAAYLRKVKEDILSCFTDFWETEEEAEDISSFMPWLMKKSPEETLEKYKVNLAVDNSGLTGAPVIVDVKPSYFGLIGEVEYDSEYGNLTADFMKIKTGALHAANGGFLIMPAFDALTVPHVFESLRRVLKSGKLVIEPLKEYLTVSISSIKPEPAPIDVKVILCGDEEYFEVLQAYDDDFAKLFKIHAPFDYEMDSSAKNAAAIVKFIGDKAEENGLPQFDEAACGRLLEHMTRLAERKDKFDSRLGKLLDLMVEAAAWHEQGDFVTGEDVTKALDERTLRNNLYEEKLTDLIDKNIIMIDTSGHKTAQINGLAVIETNDYAFAKPSRITATTYAGKAGVVNIEKEADMSGSIHDKGVEVITGYLGQKYAQEFPLSVSCRICFEQNYSGIDGDSASSTELYAILSSLADVPISQSLAVTGSTNQRGEIQPIGGVTYKIEGFFDLCKKRGLSGKQGCVIPRQNVADLTLNAEVTEAVKAGKFHVYAIDRIDDGIALLTGLSAGEKNEKGKYPSDSVHGKVYKKLKDFYKKSIDEGF